MRKKKTAIKKDILITRYYKVTYTNGDEEVFIGKDLDSATQYATDMNSYGRTLESIKEYRELLDAMTDY